MASAIDAIYVRRAIIRGKAAFSKCLNILWHGDALTTAPADVSQLSPTVSPTRRSDPTRTERAAEPRELMAERRCAS